MKLIEEGNFVAKNELFSAKDTLKFIVRMFDTQMKVRNNSISFSSASESGTENDLRLLSHSSPKT